MPYTSAVRRPVTAALALVLSVGLMACNNNTAPVANAVTAVSVAVNDTSLTVGETAQATANVTVTGTAAKTVAYSTSNSAVASVSSTGLITALTPGTATITACSTVTGFTAKCSTGVTVTVVAAPVGNPTLTPAVNINFETTGFATPSGFVSNTGAAYDAATMIGWVTQATAGQATPTALSMTNNMRNRTGVANAIAGRTPEEYTQANMQCGPATDGRTCAGGATQTAAAFEYKVINGTYTVTINVGEAVTTDFNANMALNVEGVNFVTGFVPTSATPFSRVVKDVKVTDGRLTIDAKNGVNTKIQYLKIAPAAVQQ